MEGMQSASLSRAVKGLLERRTLSTSAPVILLTTQTGPVSAVIIRLACEKRESRHNSFDCRPCSRLVELYSCWTRAGGRQVG